MRADTYAPLGDLDAVERFARDIEALGFDDLCTPEIWGDPFIPLAVAGRATERIGLRTAIAVAFPRSPMVLANTAWTLHTESRGRFNLGLGTQVKGHNERRFSVPWVAPRTRLREYVESLRAIWRCWELGEPLAYEGEHYRFTLMTPEFSPPPSGLPPIPVYIAAVRPRMMRLAGEVADGVRLHGFATRRYLAEVALPEIEGGLAAAGRARSSFEVCGGGFIATGKDEAAVSRRREWVRYRVAFYGSTRTYAPVMSLHGWDDLAAELHGMSVTGRWKEMAARVPDEVLDEFCCSATYSQLGAAVEARFGGLTDTVSLGFPGEEGSLDPELAKRWRRFTPSSVRSPGSPIADGPPSSQVQPQAHGHGSALCDPGAGAPTLLVAGGGQVMAHADGHRQLRWSTNGDTGTDDRLQPGRETAASGVCALGSAAELQVRRHHLHRSSQLSPRPNQGREPAPHDGGMVAVATVIDDAAVAAAELELPPLNTQLHGEQRSALGLQEISLHREIQVDVSSVRDLGGRRGRRRRRHHSRDHQSDDLGNAGAKAVRSTKIVAHVGLTREGHGAYGRGPFWAGASRCVWAYVVARDALFVDGVVDRSTGVVDLLESTSSMRLLPMIGGSWLVFLGCGASTPARRDTAPDPGPISESPSEKPRGEVAPPPRKIEPKVPAGVTPFSPNRFVSYLGFEHGARSDQVKDLLPVSAPKLGNRSPINLMGSQGWEYSGHLAVSWDTKGKRIDYISVRSAEAIEYLKNHKRADDKLATLWRASPAEALGILGKPTERVSRPHLEAFIYKFQDSAGRGGTLTLKYSTLSTPCRCQSVSVAWDHE